MAWTEKQRKEHSKRMKAVWDRKALGRQLYRAAEEYDEAHKGVETVTVVTSNPNIISALKAADMVTHPTHYTSHPSGVECIAVTKHMNFCLGNAIKYIWRAGQKGDYIEDLRKAKQYIEFEMERIENAKV